MPGYLDSYSMAVGVGQVRAILKIAEQLRSDGVIASDTELRDVISGLRDRITGTIGFEPAVGDGRIRSEDINGNFREIFTDLFGLYTHVDKLDNTFRAQQDSVTALRSKVRSAIRKLNQDVNQFLFLRDNPEYTQVRWVDFSDTRNLTTNRHKAAVDGNSQTLRLAPMAVERHNEARGLDGTVMTVEVLTKSSIPTVNRTFRPQHALDQDDRSFWAEVLMFDEPVKTTYQNHQGESTTVDGAVVKATVRLAKPQFINSIQILPFSLYPLKILEIRFDGVLWPGWEDKGSSFDWVDFTGIRTPVETVEIIFQQENYSWVDYMVPDWAWHNAEIWSRIVDDQLEARYEEELRHGLDRRDALTNPTSAGIIRARTRLEQLLEDRNLAKENPAKRVATFIEAILEATGDGRAPLLKAVATTVPEEGPTTSGVVELSKVEYVLGAFSIVISDVIYRPLGVYQTPEFAVDRYLTEVELAVDEAHVIGTGIDTLRRTSVEYDLVLGQNKSVPILPVNSTGTLQQEFLHVDPVSRIAQTRFTPTGPVSVYSNGVLVYRAAGQTITLSAGQYSPDAVYTADYVPATGEAVVDVEAEFLPEPTRETYRGTDENGIVQLRRLPHVVRDIVNDTSRWTRQSTRDGVWRIDPTGVPLRYGGRSYGIALSNLVTTGVAGATGLTLRDASRFPADGEIKIDNEVIAYGSKSTNLLVDIVRGLRGTQDSGHAANAVVKLVSEDHYEPVQVTVDGVKARNLTDYQIGEHQAFAGSNEDRINHEFVQIGRKVYLNKPVPAEAVVEIRYDYVAEFVAVRATLRNHQLGNAVRTPVVKQLSIRMKSL